MVPLAATLALLGPCLAHALPVEPTDVGPGYSSSRRLQAATPAWGPCDPQDCMDMTILYTSRLVGKFLPVGKAGDTCDPDNSAKCFGGNARRATYVADQKRQLAQTNETVVLADLGGSVFGGPLYGHPDYPYGVPETMLQNFVPYDLCIFSPRDLLSIDSEQARQEMGASYANRTCPFVLANAKFNEPFAAFGRKVQPYLVKQMLNGWQVGFIGMFAWLPGYSFTYRQDVVQLDSGGTLAQVFAGNYSQLLLNASQFKSEMDAAKYDYNKLGEYFRDVAMLSTQASMDVLAVAEQARRSNPGIKALVLLVGKDERPDQIAWLAKHGPFDVILMETPVSATPVTVTSSLTRRSVLIAGGAVQLGVGALKLRFSASGGVQKFSFNADVSLNSSVQANATIQAAMSSLYGFIRRKNSQPYGRVIGVMNGGERTEVGPQRYQCYYTDCPIATHIGRAHLWQARRMGYKADVSLYNLGGVRAPLSGDANGTVYISHCTTTLKFLNTLALYSILGADLYKAFLQLMVPQERGGAWAGVRVAMHEPCWDFVNHTNYSYWTDSGPPGSQLEVKACKDAGNSNPNVGIIDMQIQQVDYSQCSDWANCDKTKWVPLEKGSTYTLVSMDYLAGILPGYRPLDITLGTDAQALCDYIAAHSPLEVESWERYRDRGNVQYETAEEGWATGNRIPSVKTARSIIAEAPTCPDGMYLPPKGRACVACAAGTQSTESKARDKCDNCALGFFGDRDGMSACVACASGSFADAFGATACTACEPGRYSIVGAIYCNPCMPGTFTPHRASKQCDLCEVGSHMNHTGATACTLCEPGFVTRWQGSTSPSSCICPEGTYRPLVNQSDGRAGAGDCVECPEGMECPLGSDIAFLPDRSTGAGSWDNGTHQPYPLVLVGYMTKPEDPLKVYKCISTAACPGGPPGTCGPNRDPKAVACGVCLEGSYEADNKCRECRGNNSWMFIVIAIAGVIFVAILAIAVNRGLHKQKHSTMLCVGIIAIQVSGLQALGIFQSMDLSWFEPTASILRVVRLFAFDIQVLHSQCYLGSQPVANYATRQCIAPACTIPILLVLVIKRIRFTETRLGADFCNAVGTIFNVFYISIIISCCLPFICLEHPNGNGFSMSSSPSIFCFVRRGSWIQMAVISAISMCVVPIPFTIAVLYGVWKYPVYVSRSGAINSVQLHRFRFFFFRFHPQRYYYGLLVLLRSLLIALVPVVASQDKAIQVLLMCALLLFFLLSGLELRPWRVARTNIVEAVCTALLLLLLFCGAMSTDMKAKEESLRVLSAAILAALALAFLVVFSAAVIHHLAPRPYYDRFVCHHKEHAGAQARLVKMLFQARGMNRVFVDSDDLSELDTLFDTVKTKVSQLIVLLTQLTLTRPWCAGEIYTAVKSSVKLVAVLMPSFLPPSEENYADLESYLDLTSCSLTEYGIDCDGVAGAYRKLLNSKDTRTLEMQMRVQGTKRYDRLVDDLLAKPATHDVTEQRIEAESGALIVSSEPGNDEATAAAGILAVKIQAELFGVTDHKLMLLCDFVEDFDATISAVTAASAVIVLLSHGSLSSNAQIGIIVQGMSLGAMGGDGVSRRATGTASPPPEVVAHSTTTRKTTVSMLPVALPYFKFPRADYYVEVLPNFCSDMSLDHATQMIESFFKLIAVSFHTHMSDKVLNAQALEIWSRLPRRGRDSGTKRHAPVASPRAGKGYADDRASDPGDAAAAPSIHFNPLVHFQEPPTETEDEEPPCDGADSQGIATMGGADDEIGSRWV